MSTRSGTRRRGPARRGERALEERLDGLGFEGTPRALTDPLRTIVARHELRTGAPLPRATAVASALPGEDTDVVAHALSALVAHDYERRVCRVAGSWMSTSPVAEGRRGASHDSIEETTRWSDALMFTPGQPLLATLRARDVLRSDGSPHVQAAEIRRLVARLGDEFDHIVLEAPGVLVQHDAETVLNESEGYVLVVRRGTSTDGQVSGTTSLAASTVCLGAVLTDFGRRRSRRAARSRGSRT